MFKKGHWSNFPKYDGSRVIPFLVWFLPIWTTLSYWMDHSESSDDLENCFKKSAINGRMCRKIKIWVFSCEKCTKNNKKAEKTSFFSFQGQGQIQWPWKCYQKIRHVEMIKKGHWTIFVNMLVYYVAEFLCFWRVFCVLGQIWPPLEAKRELCQSWGIMGYIRKAIYN